MGSVDPDAWNVNGATMGIAASSNIAARGGYYFNGDGYAFLMPSELQLGVGNGRIQSYGATYT